MDSASQPANPAPPKRKKKEKKLGTSRGIETLFRNTYRVHVEVSALADAKANFLITINTFIVLLIVSYGMSNVTYKELLLPIGIVLATCIGSMIFAVLVARPRISGQKSPTVPLQQESTNLLFFGSFTKMSKEEFIEQMTDTIRDADKLYPLMMADIYTMGKVLERKFNRLKIAYAFLLYGLPVGVVIFVIMQSLAVAGRLSGE